MKLAALLLTASVSSAQGFPVDLGGDAWRAAWFVDRSEDTGTLWQHNDSLYSALSGGAGWLDADGDGDEDLVLASQDGKNTLLRNDGLRFTDLGVASGLQSGAQSMGVIVGDYDQDGLSDVYMTNSGPNHLWRSNGDGSFSDVAPQLGCAGNVWSMSASFADFDLDGDLDLYVGNYIAVLNFPYHYGVPNALYENQGAAAGFGFVERAAALGVDGAGVFGPSVPGYSYTSPQGQPTAGCTNSVATLDYDEDGDPDLFEGNDFALFVMPNSQWRNDLAGGALAFTEVSSATGFDLCPQYNMGISAADYDRDGDWDFYLSDIGDNVLFRNDGGVFTDVAHAAGPTEEWNEAGTVRLASWGTAFGDFDNDGFEDLFVVNGHIPTVSFLANDRVQPNHLWRNRADGTFERIEPAKSGLADGGPGRGVAPCDVDRDGQLDLYVVNNGALGLTGLYISPSRLFFGRGPTDPLTRRWFQLALAGRGTGIQASNLEGIGARVELMAGGATQRRQVLADPVYLSSASRTLHFGLGSAAAVEALTVHWPSGITQQLVELPADLRLELREPLVTVAAVAAPTWSADVLHLAATLTNHDAGAQTPATSFRISLPDGTPLVKLPVAAILGGPGVADVTLDLPLPAALRDALVGMALELTVACDDGAGGLDSERLSFLLP